MRIAATPEVLEREERVIALRSEGKLFREIGAILGVTGSRVRQIYQKGLRRRRLADARSAKRGA